MNQWLNFNKKYIIVPLGNELLIFDQHAVHERILYDKFKIECQQQTIVSMPLLIPEYVELNNHNQDLLTHLIPSLKSIGIDIDTFDQNQLIIREVPQLFSTMSVANWLAESMDQDGLNELIEHSEENKIKTLQMKACKAAVKSGQQLHDAEIESLIELVINSDQQFTCPHGRPLFLK